MNSSLCWTENDLGDAKFDFHHRIGVTPETRRKAESGLSRPTTTTPATKAGQNSHLGSLATNIDQIQVSRELLRYAGVHLMMLGEVV